MNLGTALRTLGERESGTARLEEAVAAYRAALEERTRDRVPLDWAMTQHNLGNALSTLGEREAGTALMEDAVTAYDAALEVFVSGGADYYIDACINNREDVQMLLAERQRRRRTTSTVRSRRSDSRKRKRPGWRRRRPHMGERFMGALYQ
jgi:tetratricopeptide (TPR) repeat protein